MKFLLLHFSDMHFNASTDHILKKKALILKAVQNQTQECEHIFILITGDITYSGKEPEYFAALEFVESIKKYLEQYSKKTITLIMIPGNHDCDHSHKNKHVRETLIKEIQQNGLKKDDDGTLDFCCEVQQKFFEFEQCYAQQIFIFTSKLLKIASFKFEKLEILFKESLINSSLGKRVC